MMVKGVACFMIAIDTQFCRENNDNPTCFPGLSYILGTLHRRQAPRRATIWQALGGET